MPSSNPLWFGYYPGDRPVPKRPDRRFPTPPPVDMSDMGLNAVIDEAIRVTEIPAEMPGQLWDWIISDWKQQLEVTGVAYKQTGGDIMVYEAQEGADVAGVNPSINLYNLVTNPKKEVGRALSKIINPLNPFAGVRGNKGEFWTDLDTSLERDMWRSLLRPPKGTKPLLYNWVESVYTPVGGGGPMDLTGQGVFAEAKVKAGDLGKVTLPGQTDVYDDLAGNILGFVAGKKSVLKRNLAFVVMDSSFVKAAATELAQKKSTLLTAAAADSRYGPTGARELGIQINQFLAEANVADSINKFSFDMKGFNDTIAIRAIANNPTVDELQRAVAVDPTKRSDFDVCVTKLRDDVAVAKATLTGPLKVSFEHDIKGVEDVLTRTEAIQTKILGLSPTGTLSMLEVEALRSELAVVRGSLFNLRHGAGAQGSYLQSLTRRYFGGQNSLLSVGLVDPSSGLPIMTQGYRSLGSLYPYLERMYMYEDGRDLLASISEGKFPKTYLWWGQIRDRVQVFTPTYWTGKVMHGTHMFGLNYDEDWEGKEIHKFFNTNPLIQQNRFKVSFTTTLSSSGKVVNSTGAFDGGKHVLAAFGAWESFKKDLLIGNFDTFGHFLGYGTSDQNKRALLDLLNGKHDDFLNANPGFQYLKIFSTGAKKNIEAVENIEIFRNALKANQATLGLTFVGDELANTPENFEILKGMFDNIVQIKADPATISPFIAKYGALQWASAKLTGFQQDIFTKTRIGKAFAPFVRAKNAAFRAISDSVRGAVTKVLLRTGITAALGAATGGVAAFLVPLLEKVFQAVLSKVIDKGKDLVKAALKGDLVGEVNKIMDEGINVVEKILACGCFVPVILAVIGMMMFTPILSAISSISISIAPDTSWNAPAAAPLPTANSCVFPPSTYVVTARSYAGVNVPPAGTGVLGTWRHGSNDYWYPKDNGPEVRGIADCSYQIPSLAPSPPPSYSSDDGDTSSYCFGKSPAASYYGYAMDVAPIANAGTAVAYAPLIAGVTQWTIIPLSGKDGPYDTGCAASLNGISGSTVYAIYLLHLNCGVLNIFPAGQSTISPGASISTLKDYYLGPHVHVEMQINSNYVRPEDYLCP